MFPFAIKGNVFNRLSMKKNILLSFLLLYLIPFIGVAQKNTTFEINGKIDTLPFTKFYTQLLIDADVLKDSIILDKNSLFKYSANINEPAALLLLSANSHRVNEVIYSFWVEPGKIIDFEGLKIIKRKNKDFKITNSETEYLQRMYRDSLEGLSKELTELFKKQFIHEHIDTYYALWSLEWMARTNSLNDDYIKSMLMKVPEKFKYTYRYKKIQSILETRIGAQMKNLHMSDTLGNESSIIAYRGKYLLLEFWASWCAPCRQENPNLLKWYNCYHAKGLEIISFSFDEKRSDWIRAINEDKLPWLQVSDLAGFGVGAVATQLAVKAIPDNFLIDPEGKIIARGLQGKALEKKLAECFQK